MEAILDPHPRTAGHDRQLRRRLHFRFVDAVKPQRRRLQVNCRHSSTRAASRRTEGPRLAGSLGRDGRRPALSLIKDERKRLAFALTMANHPKGEIAATLKIDLKTLYLWLREVREFLKTELDL